MRESSIRSSGRKRITIERSMMLLRRSLGRGADERVRQLFSWSDKGTQGSCQGGPRICAAARNKDSIAETHIDSQAGLGQSSAPKSRHELQRRPLDDRRDRSSMAYEFPAARAARSAGRHRQTGLAGAIALPLSLTSSWSLQAWCFSGGNSSIRNPAPRRASLARRTFAQASVQQDLKVLFPPPKCHPLHFCGRISHFSNYAAISPGQNIDLLTAN